MTTPAVAPEATPAAVAPAVAPAATPPVEPVVAPAAAPVEPAVAPVVPAAAPAAAATLFDGVAPTEPPVAAPAAAPTAVVPPIQPISPDKDTPKWYYGDGTPGKGAAPEWFKADKYVSVEEQAKAYNNLEKRFGAFVGAPKDGKYEFKPIEGLGVELDTAHPLLADFTKWAGTNQLSQAGYQELVGMLAQYEAAQLPDHNAIKAEIGEKADERVAAALGWAKANLKPDQLAAFTGATGGTNAAVVFKAFEALIAKTVQPTITKATPDVAPPVTHATFQQEMAAVDDKGQNKYFNDPIYREQVEKRLREHVAANPQ